MMNSRITGGSLGGVAKARDQRRKTPGDRGRENWSGQRTCGQKCARDNRSFAHLSVKNDSYVLWVPAQTKKKTSKKKCLKVRELNERRSFVERTLQCEKLTTYVIRTTDISHTAMFSILHHFLDEPENKGRSLMVSILCARPPYVFLLTPQTFSWWHGSFQSSCLADSCVCRLLPLSRYLYLAAPSLPLVCSQVMAAGTIGHSAAFKQEDDFYKTMAGLPLPPAV